MVPTTRITGSFNGSSLVFDDETRRYIADQIAQMVGGAMQTMNTRLDEMATEITGLSLQNIQMGNGHGGGQMQHSRVAKIDFPKFSGEDVRGWVFRCEQLFLINQVAEIDKVNFVSIHLYDKALLWHTQFMKIHGGFVDWGVYKQAVLARFGNVYDDPMSELKNLKYETSAKEYKDAFDNLLSRVKISETHALSLFMGGLPTEIAMGVRMFKPQTLADAYCLTNLQEATLEAVKKKNRPVYSGNNQRYGANTGGNSFSKPLLPLPTSHNTTVKPKPNTPIGGTNRRLTQKEYDGLISLEECCGEQVESGEKADGIEILVGSNGFAMNKHSERSLTDEHETCIVEVKGNTPKNAKENDGMNESFSKKRNSDGVAMDVDLVEECCRQIANGEEIERVNGWKYFEGRKVKNKSGHVVSCDVVVGKFPWRSDDDKTSVEKEEAYNRKQDDTRKENKDLEVEKNNAKGKYENCGVVGFVGTDVDLNLLKVEAKYLKDCGTIPQTLVEIRNIEKLKGSDDVDNGETQSWLQNVSIENLDVKKEIDQLPSLQSYATGQNSKRLFSISSYVEALDVDIDRTLKPNASRNTFVWFECEIDTSQKRGCVIFDLWKWPNRKKKNHVVQSANSRVACGSFTYGNGLIGKRARVIFCWKEGMFSSYSSACSLGYTLDIHQFFDWVTRLDIHQFVHLIIVIDDMLWVIGLNETDMILFEQYLVQGEAGIFSTNETDQGEAETMISEYLHTVNFKIEPYEGVGYTFQPIRECLFSVLKEWISRDEIQKYSLVTDLEDKIILREVDCYGSLGKSTQKST